MSALPIPATDGWARARAASPMYRRWKGDIITPQLIGYCQKWLTKYGIEATLVIERVGDRNRVALRSCFDSNIHEAEVAALNALRKKSPTAPMESVLLLFVRTA